MVGLSRGLMQKSYQDLIGEYEALPLKETVIEKWLYHNAARFFRLRLAVLAINDQRRHFVSYAEHRLPSSALRPNAYPRETWSSRIYWPHNIQARSIPVHPTATTIDGLQVVPSPDELPADIDLAVLAIPASGVYRHV